MTKFTQQMMNKFSILAIALIVGIGTMTACQSEKQSADNNSPTANKEQNSVAGDKAAADVSANDDKSEETKTEKTPEPAGKSGNRKAVSGAEVTGTFQMPIGGDFKDMSNEIKILALGNNKLKVSFELINPNRFGPGKDDVTANVGNAAGEADINGDTAVYSVNEGGGQCDITIKFVKPGQIKVTQTEEDRGCGFGLNVYANGTYKKTDGAKPTFDAVE